MFAAHHLPEADDVDVLVEVVRFLPDPQSLAVLLQVQRVHDHRRWQHRLDGRLEDDAGVALQPVSEDRRAAGGDAQLFLAEAGAAIHVPQQPSEGGERHGGRAAAALENSTRRQSQSPANTISVPSILGGIFLRALRPAHNI